MRLPQPRLHKASGQARIRFGGRDIYLGRFGSEEAEQRYREVIAELAIEGRDETQVQRRADAATDSFSTAALPPALLEPPVSITVGELCVAWLKDIQRTKGDNYREKSLWYGARVAARALRPVATMAAADFGPRALLNVREQFASGQVVYRDRNGNAVTERPRTRRYVNDTMGRIVQLFRWAAIRELVPGDRPAALREVPALKRGEFATVNETPKRRPVPAEVLEATLAKLPEPTRRLVQFLRLVGCRPGEAACLRLCDVDRSDPQAWRYMPDRHKNAWRGHSRVIAIGPRAQAIVLEALGGRSPDDLVFMPKRSAASIPIRQAVGGFSSATIRNAIQRAANAAGVPRWTTYQLRHTRAHEVRLLYGPDAAKAVLGDKTAAMLDMYSEADFSLACQAAAATG
jgi:integrase